MGSILSLLQHMRQTQPGSPLRAINTVRFLERVRNFELESCYLPSTDTMLLVSVHRAPMNVRNATVLKRTLAGVLGKFLKEYRPVSQLVCAL